MYIIFTSSLPQRCYCEIVYLQMLRVCMIHTHWLAGMHGSCMYIYIYTGQEFDYLTPVHTLVVLHLFVAALWSQLHKQNAELCISSNLILYNIIILYYCWERKLAGSYVRRSLTITHSLAHALTRYTGFQGVGKGPWPERGEQHTQANPIHTT